MGLGVAVLRAGGDAEVLDLDREHHLGQLVGRQDVAVQRAQGAHVAVTIALDPPRPTSRGTVVDQRTAHGPRPKRATAASTSALGGSLSGSRRGVASARAASPGTQTASTAPP